MLIAERVRWERGWHSRWSVRPVHPHRPRGVGEVWLASHVDGSPEDPPVAIKVLTDHAARDPEYVRAFKREVELASRLDHPHILLVHDFGEIPSEAEQRSHGGLKAGSPWLAMELAEGGHVGERIGALSWRELRWILQCVLDALAHAHARGVVHRDIKPENVLLGETGVKVSDFGLAHAGGHVLHHHAGTPHYMAPEQIEGRWRDWGPWTDLYAVGCLGWTLATPRSTRRACEAPWRRT
ncbi:MAG: serine/threonine protein kinase [Proteobacteria bacterium]|nr:serine/threonine protein kinase [Pseudomonadota bacterium]MCP4915734.1 serine/threonine protein kinase [Pseudomonadota bacterium]